MMQLSLQAHGHPLLRATHGKSIEITSHPEITTRATCIIGVRATLHAQLRMLRGRVKVVLSSGDAVAEIVGQVNPSYDSDSRLVIRRSGVADHDTFLVHADTTADELPRKLVNALRNGDAVLHVEILELQQPPPVAIVGPDRGRGWRRVGGLDDDARQLTLRAERIEDLVDAPIAVQLRKRDARWLVEGYDGVNGPMIGLLLSAGVRTAPLLFAGALPLKRQDRAQLLRAVAASPYTVVLHSADQRARPDEIAEILGAQRRVLIGDGVIDLGWRAMELPAGELDVEMLARPPHLLVLPRVDDLELAVIDPHILAKRLLDAGLSQRSVDDVLNDLGFGRRFLYRA
jgi:hypothetical protein